MKEGREEGNKGEEKWEEGGGTGKKREGGKVSRERASRERAKGFRGKQMVVRVKKGSSICMVGEWDRGEGGRETEGINLVFRFSQG